MILTDLKSEYGYRLQERIGHLREDRKPTPEQLALAEAEARAIIERLNKSRIDKGFL